MSQAPELLLTIEGVCRALNVGPTTAKALISSGAIESVLIGRCRRVPIEALRDYVAKLRTGQR
ncbi:MAG TPA: helix-turn-helix domain-containing protein [Candidatus Limnocylindrales bacterium]